MAYYRTYYTPAYNKHFPRTYSTRPTRLLRPNITTNITRKRYNKPRFNYRKRKNPFSYTSYAKRRIVENLPGLAWTAASLLLPEVVPFARAAYLSRLAPSVRHLLKYSRYVRPGQTKALQWPKAKGLFP